MNHKNVSLLFGFSAWLMMTMIFRFWGHAFFQIGNTVFMIGFFLGTIPAFYPMVKWLFNRYQLVGKRKIESAVLIVIPGMLGDVFCINFYEMVFPAMTIEQAVPLAAWILWAFLIVLLIGVFESGR